MSEGVPESTHGTDRKNSVFEGHNRVKSMLMRKYNPVLENVNLEDTKVASTNRDAIMTPSAASRAAVMNQNKINEFRRRLRSQNAGRNPRIRNAELDLPNNAGGYQVGFVSNGISDIEVNKHAEGTEMM